MKKSLLAVVLTLSSVAAWAVMPQAGKVYRVTNSGYGTSLVDQGPGNPVGCATSSSTSMSQRWYVKAGTNGSLVFQSLGTGNYLKSSNALSQTWSMSVTSTPAACQLTVTPSGNDYTVKAAGQNDILSMHCDGSANIVCWSADNTYSKWNFTEISMTQAEIDAALAEFADVLAQLEKAPEYEATLAKIFSDKACTTLNSTYAGMTEANLKNDANYKALPSALQNMVLKVKTGNWAETSGNWDSAHARKYRVQLYEPFSSAEPAAALTGIQAYTNMNNPTGIVGNPGDMLYVFVEGEIKEGSQVYMGNVTGYGMFNNVTSGTELHTGLNIIPVYADCAHQFIYYTVNTVDQTGAKPRPSQYKVTEFPNLKIHIEGGSLNGFFNYIGDDLYTPDTADDFYYTSNRATHPMYDMLGKYVILHFFLEDTPGKAGATTLGKGLKTVMDPAKNPAPSGRKYSYDMAQIMNNWDNMCFRERTFMGLQSDAELAKYNHDLLWDFYEPLTGDAIAKHPAGNTWATDPGFQYADYFNNRMMGITMQGDLFMNATWWRTAYNISTMTAILCESGYDSGSMWGPAHEYGHMNQTPMKFAGTTEESNNIFSNVAVYYMGLNTSRSAVPLEQLKVFNNDGTFLENDTWGTTRMFLQLWLYYHACGHNKKFYPRLYELLRNNPLQKSYYLNQRYDQCHFAKMCCIAAQEDLTDYFESWGMFVPLDNYHIGDYSNFMATLTPADAQAVKDEIAALGLPKNRQIMLIDDRPGSTRNSWYASEMAIEKAGPLGGVEDFRANVKPSGSLSYNLEDGYCVINHSNGTAGVGFLMYDADGTLLAFSNDYRFPLKKKAVAAVMSGTAKVYAIGADGTEMELTNDYANAPIETHVANLVALTTSVADVFNRIDPEDLKAGWYTEYYSRPFLAAYNAAKNADASALTKADVTALYISLVNEYEALKNHTHAQVRFIPGSTYQIISAEFPTRAIAASASKSTATNATMQKNPKDSQSWKFVASTSANQYYIQNVATSKYLGKPYADGEGDNGSSLRVTESKSEAGLFTIQEMSTGQFALLNDGNDKYSPNVQGSSATGNICLWNASTLGSQWFLRLVEANEKNGALEELKQLHLEAQDLLPKAGIMNIDGENVELTEDMLFSNATCKVTTYGDQFTSYNVLIDGDLQTFFHTDYSGANTSDGKDHYIRVDLGEGNSLNSVQVYWTNRDVAGSNAAVTNPQTMKVDASNDANSWVNLATLTGLPSTSGASYSSPVISDGNDYRYWRVMCTKGAGSAGGHQYFAIAEFGISGAVENIIPFEQYPNVTPELMVALRSEIENTSTFLAGTTFASTKVTKTYEALLAAYNSLAAAMGVEVPFHQSEINEITFDAAASQGIYNLQGRRLAAPIRGTVNIINGQKVLVK